MPYPKESPQQLLGVGRAFSRQELVKAMGKAIKADHTQAAKYRAAFNDLADTRRRLEYEILLPHGNVELERELEQLVAKLGKDRYLPQTCPTLLVPRALIDLGNMGYERDFSEVNFESPKIVLSANYDEVGRAKLPIIFDK